MADWLIRQGIDPARILLEDRSRNTEENIRFSAQLLQNCGIDARRMIITTDWWHQLRARVWVERQNYTYYSLPCATYPPLQILFLARELCGIVRLLLLGY